MRPAPRLGGSHSAHFWLARPARTFFGISRNSPHASRLNDTIRDKSQSPRFAGRSDPIHDRRKAAMLSRPLRCMSRRLAWQTGTLFGLALFFVTAPRLLSEESADDPPTTPPVDSK